MPQDIPSHSTPPARRRRQGDAPANDAAFLDACAAYHAALAEQAAVNKAINVAWPGADRARIEALDDRCAAAVKAQFEALYDAAQAAHVVTPGGRRARAELFLRAMEDLAEHDGELQKDGAELMLARAIARDALAAS